VYEGEFKEVCFGAHTGHSPLGVSSGFQEGQVECASPEDKKHQERVGENFNQLRNVLQEDGGDFGPSEIISDGNAIFKGFHRRHGTFCEQQQVERLGPKAGGPRIFETTGERRQCFDQKLGGAPLFKQQQKTGITFRQFNPGLGGVGHRHRTICAGILEGKECPPHQCERVGGSYCDGEKFGQKRGDCSFVGGQFSGFLLSQKKWGKAPVLQCHDEALPGMVSPQGSHPEGGVGPQRGDAGGQVVKVDDGRGGLLPRPPPVQVHPQQFQGVGLSRSGNICLTRKLQIEKFRFPLAPFSGGGSGRSGLSVEKFSGGLCKPPLASHFALAPKTTTKSTFGVSHGGPFVGLRHLVAPSSKVAREQNTMLGGGAIPGNVHRLSGDVYAAAQVAPSLSSVIRQKLEEQQVPPKIVADYLLTHASLSRYESAFKLLWCLLVVEGVDLPRQS
jgi:hypothetical protein